MWPYTLQLLELMVHIDVMSCNAVLSAGDGQKLGYIGASKIFLISPGKLPRMGEFH